MIKINLLPYRETEKKENLRRQVILAASSFVLFVLAIGFFQGVLQTSIRGLEKEIKDKESQLALLTKTVADVEKFKKDKAFIEQKLQIIRDLDQDRTEPVRVFGDLAALLPVRDAWLVKVRQSGATLQIEGVARDNSAVAQFMRNLEAAPFLASVNLQVIKQMDMAGQKLQQFHLACTMHRGW